jgi:predicted nuclease of predicted toxin-antitoxin system
MKLLIDMNLSPDWVEALTAEGIEAVHWVNVGSASASDREIMVWAKSG